ncbi:proline-rich domain-containing protein [Streptomyces sp. NPDC059696]|uniref:proline-rich domain-containing protein n=1 Tax=Streptomyces sp. NPDC059696 TaxID=3346911 RepID=UPI0036AD5240
MSYGDPNNPYGAPQGQPQQPGYGYPQDQGQAPGYGYPQAPPVSPYGGPAAPTTMPGSVSAARVMMWVIVGLQVLGVAIFAFSAVALNAAKDDESLKDNTAFQDLVGDSTGVIWGYVVFGLAWLVFAAVLATKFKNGGNGARVTILVFAIITAVLGIYPFVIVGLVHTVLAVLVAVFVGNAAGKAWFNRPRY